MIADFFGVLSHRAHRARKPLNMLVGVCGGCDVIGFAAQSASRYHVRLRLVRFGGIPSRPSVALLLLRCARTCRVGIGAAIETRMGRLERSAGLPRLSLLIRTCSAEVYLKPYAALN